MTLKSDIQKLKPIPGELYWNKKELDKRKNEIELIIKKINPDKGKAILEKLKSATKRLENIHGVKEIEEANTMIKMAQKYAETIDEKTLNELENHEGIAKIATTQPQKKYGFLKKVASGIMIGIAAVTFNLYHPHNANANGMSTITKDGKNQLMTNYGPTGEIGKEKVTVYGPTGVTDKGKTVIIYNNNKTSSSTDTTQTTPKFNYKTPQLYFININKAAQNNDFQKVIDLSEEALYRISQGTLKATPTQIKDIDNCRKIGYEHR